MGHAPASRREHQIDIAARKVGLHAKARRKSIQRPRETRRRGLARNFHAARKRGITHVALQATPGLATQMLWIKSGSRDPDLINKSLAARLVSPISHIPDWLEPVPHYGSPSAARHRMRIYRVNRAMLEEDPPNP